MYNVKLQTGLSSSADDHSISEPQNKRGTWKFLIKLLKKAEPVYRKLYCLYWVRASLRCGLSGLCYKKRGVAR